ncbi:hypothetical protein FVE85_4663 [Porphyridium purpureum]|uniref:RING-type domain-containing protein n=1 Tax=Porphyridium purpureum TaxID=35688 RepID=A0A5J4YQH7_PORPP|nr:hypothetical protein FVE85_4663 [Porphyridium purpureum]|eukprot:POR2180..scf236_6
MPGTRGHRGAMKKFFRKQGVVVAEPDGAGGQASQQEVGVYGAVPGAADGAAPQQGYDAPVGSVVEQDGMDAQAQDSAASHDSGGVEAAASAQLAEEVPQVKANKWGQKLQAAMKGGKKKPAAAPSLPDEGGEAATQEHYAEEVAPAPPQEPEMTDAEKVLAFEEAQLRKEGYRDTDKVGCDTDAHANAEGEGAEAVQQEAAPVPADSTGTENGNPQYDEYSVIPDLTADDLAKAAYGSANPGAYYTASETTCEQTTTISDPSAEQSFADVQNGINDLNFAFERERIYLESSHGVEGWMVQPGSLGASHMRAQPPFSAPMAPAVFPAPAEPVPQTHHRPTQEQQAAEQAQLGKKQLNKALDLDKDKDYTAAMDHYITGVSTLMDAIKSYNAVGSPNALEEVKKLRKFVGMTLDRMESVKKIIEKQKEQQLELEAAAKLVGIHSGSMFVPVEPTGYYPSPGVQHSGSSADFQAGPNPSGVHPWTLTPSMSGVMPPTATLSSSMCDLCVVKPARSGLPCGHGLCESCTGRAANVLGSRCPECHTPFSVERLKRFT